MAHFAVGAGLGEGPFRTDEDPHGERRRVEFLALSAPRLFGGLDHVGRIRRELEAKSHRMERSRERQLQAHTESIGTPGPGGRKGHYRMDTIAPAFTCVKLLLRGAPAAL